MLEKRFFCCCCWFFFVFLVWLIGWILSCLHLQQSRYFVHVLPLLRQSTISHRCCDTRAFPCAATVFTTLKTAFSVWRALTAACSHDGLSFQPRLLSRCMHYILLHVHPLTCRVVVAQTFNPSTQEAEAGRSLWVQSQPGLQSESQDSQDCYIEKPCPTNQKDSLTWFRM